jgi:hypothetical protein
MEDEEIQAQLAELDVQTRSLIIEADLGQQAKEFFASPLGKYILGCASQEIMEAQMALAEVNWWNIWGVKQQQNRIWRARSLIAWVGDLVRSGRSAEHALAETE